MLIDPIWMPARWLSVIAIRGLRTFSCRLFAQCLRCSAVWRMTSVLQAINTQYLAHDRLRIATTRDDATLGQIGFGIVRVLQENGVCLVQVPVGDACEQVMGQVQVVPVHADKQPLPPGGKTVAGDTQGLLLPAE